MENSYDGTYNNDGTHPTEADASHPHRGQSAAEVIQAQHNQIEEGEIVDEDNNNAYLVNERQQLEMIG